jgi:hypothetical protein
MKKKPQPPKAKKQKLIIKTKKPEPIKAPIQAAADKAVLMAGVATIEANQRFLASRVEMLEKTINEFLDLLVVELEKSIGANFASPFKLHLKTLAERYDQLPKPNAVLDKSVEALKANEEPAF